MIGFRWIAMVIGASILSSCARSVASPDVRGFPLVSPDFASGAVMPKASTCDGAGTSPGLEWHDSPRETVSIAVVARDLDSPLPMLFGHFVHWVLYDWPASEPRIAARLAASPQLANGARQGTNGFDKIGYGGPCPPGSAAHRYVFTAYALDETLALPPGASEKELLRAMAGHIIAAAELIGRYR